ncbi:hypothetical protein SUDANB171_00616 [Streptomyces sp. enrichment culture]|uniref:hypothetical protein n=1 Tax=Streptomyces sp. enrichment culture TaxID=1795815 RepID=UPI003F56ED42
MTTHQQLFVRADHESDRHLYVDCPEQGPLGWCAEHDGDEVNEETGEYWYDPLDEKLVGDVPARDGWIVTGEWCEPFDGEPYHDAPYVAPAVRVELTALTDAQ